MGKKSGSGSGMNIPDHISKCLETNFLGNNFLMRIRDGKNSNPGWKKSGSWINIPAPQHLWHMYGVMPTTFSVAAVANSNLM
jgi:hypothetical protein